MARPVELNPLSSEELELMHALSLGLVVEAAEAPKRTVDRLRAIGAVVLREERVTATDEGLENYRRSVSDAMQDALTWPSPSD